MNSCIQGLCHILWSQNLDSLMKFPRDPVVKNASGLENFSYFFSHFYFLFTLFSVILFLEPGLGLE